MTGHVDESPCWICRQRLPAHPQCRRHRELTAVTLTFLLVLALFATPLAVVCWIYWANREYAWTGTGWGAVGSWTAGIATFTAVVVALWESARARKSAERELAFARNENRYLQGEARKHQERQEVRPVLVQLRNLEKMALELEEDFNSDIYDSGVPLHDNYRYQLDDYRDPVKRLIKIEIAATLTAVQIAGAMIGDPEVLGALCNVQHKLKEMRAILENFQEHIDRGEVGPDLQLGHLGENPSTLVKKAFVYLASSTRVNLQADLPE